MKDLVQESEVNKILISRKIYSTTKAECRGIALVEAVFSYGPDQEPSFTRKLKLCLDEDFSEAVFFIRIMNSSQEKVGRKPLQGPRPPPLRVSRESHQVRKPPVPNQHRPPVIIYAHSPEIIHADARDFKTLVQRLIGQSASNPDLYPQPPPTPAFEASLSPYASNFRVSSNNFSPFPFPQRESEKFICNNSPASPNIPSNLFSPLSPNLFLPSPRLLSPSIFQDLPLFTPQLQSGYSDHFFSPGHVFHKQSEILFTPLPFIRPYTLWSPSPTGFDIFNNRP